ncbi:MAG: hypothetical protein JXA69_00250 [Phycisphaerae bacterium]|nr:hypothetical protein [Phycisphaerae bacterium]
MQKTYYLLSAAIGLSLMAPALAQVDTKEAQNKLLSKRAAEADAYRKLAECIKGLQITSDTYVRDFVTESDTIHAEMDEFIRGVRLGDPKWYEDLSCEVPAEVTVEKVIETLKAIHTRFYDGDRIKGTDFTDMEKRIDRKIIKVVGMGAPRPDLPADLPEGVASQLGSVNVPLAIPPLWEQMGPQARLMAVRAARLDALRKLLERIKGLRINSDTLVRDFVTEFDSISAEAQGLVVGAEEVRTYLHHDEPIAEVTMEIPVEQVVTIIKQLHTRSIQGDSIKGTDIEDVTRRIKTKTFQATGMGIPPTKALAVYTETVKAVVPDLPPWATQKITMTGAGVPPADKAGTPQGKLMAARAAELDAKRKLGEHINGLVIQSQTTVRDFVTENDDIATQMDAILVGSTVEKTEFDGETANVTVSIPGIQVWEIVHERLRIIRRAG